MDVADLTTRKVTLMINEADEPSPLTLDRVYKAYSSRVAELDDPPWIELTEADYAALMIEAGPKRPLSLPAPVRLGDSSGLPVRLMDRVYSVRLLRCDGDHGSPQCFDPGCWHAVPQDEDFGIYAGRCSLHGPWKSNVGDCPVCDDEDPGDG